MVSPRWSAVRTPAVWILLPLTALGGLVGLLLAVVPAIFAPRSTAVVCLIMLVVSAGWVWFVLRWADPVERRPWWLVAVALCWGGGAAVLVAMGGNYYFDRMLGRAVSPDFAATWGPALFAPTVEELAKVAGVVVVLLVARPFVTTAWAGAIYGALVGVGFAGAEDAQYGSLAADEALPDDLHAGLGTLLLRLIVLGPVGHPLFTGLAGAGVAYAWLRHDAAPRRRWAVLLATFGSAWLLHFAVNSPVGPAVGAALGPLPGVTDLAGYLLVATGLSVPALWWLARLRGHDARVVLHRAATLAPGLVGPHDVAVLAGLRSRRRAGREVRRQAGVEAARAARRLRRAQLRFAAALSRPHGGYPPIGPPGWLVLPVLHRWADVDAARRAAELPGTAQPAVGTAAAGPVRAGNGWLWVAGLLVAVAVLGLLWWPFAVVAAPAAGVFGWLARGRGTATATAVVAAAVTGYVWLLQLVGQAFFPE